jgi:hypothetical protein
VTELFRDFQRDDRIGLVTRRLVMTLLAAIALAGLLNVFGQHAKVSTATEPAATLRVDAPTRVRGGLFFQTRIEVDATAPLKTPRLVFDPGVFEGMQVSSIEPAPAAEDSRNGRVVLEFEPIEPRETLRVWMQFQVDPTTMGERSYNVELNDGTDPVARVERDLFVFP